MEHNNHTPSENAAQTAAPVAKKVPHVIELHGNTLTDNYFWMRDLKGDADVMPHLEAENKYADSYMSDTQALQDKLFTEMRGRIKEADTDVPIKRGKWLYYWRTEEGKQYGKYCRKRDRDGAVEEVLLDQDALAQGHAFYQLGGASVSPSGNFLAYMVDTKGFRQFTLVVKNLRTGKTLSTTAERVTSVAWASDNKTLFYTTEDEVTKRSNMLFRHKVGQKKHHFVHEEKDEYFRIGVTKSRTGKFIFLQCGSHTTSEIRMIRADQPKGQFVTFLARQPQVMYSVEHDGDNFWVVTNENARDGRLLLVPFYLPGPKAWQEVIPHRPGVSLEGVEAFAKHLVIQEKENGLRKIRIIDRATKEEHYVTFPETAYEAGLGNNPEFDTTTIRLGYVSMVTPSTTFSYDLEKRELTSLKKQEVAGYDPSLYVTERLYATASDGTPVPVSIVYKKGLKKDGTNPLHLYGYGSYGASIPASFSSARLSLLDRGVIYAIAHIRGGGELGEQWRLDGKMKKKMNTFTDFITCGKFLVAQGYTSHDRMTIEGRSAGGLLMGAVMNLDRGLAKAALVGVPFLDVINTMLDETLPLTVGEFEEWGNPKVKEDYECMSQYSPYENVVVGDYPAMLVKSALWDSQVAYWEPAKYVAKQRELNSGKNPILFKCMLEAGGHGGPSGRFDALKDVAYDYAFLLKQLGITA